MKALVNKIIPFSAVDGPGNRTVVFMQGCNMNCLYCHNPETINRCLHCGICIAHCPTNALENFYGKVKWDREKCIECGKCEKICPHNASPRFTEYDVSDLLSQILKYKHFIKGVTFSGGECSIQYEFITEIAKELKKHNLGVYVDTNGLIELWAKQEFVDSVDAFMLDVKAWDKDEHIQLTGVSNDVIIKNLDFLLSRKKLFEIRTVVLPELLSNEQTVTQVSLLISGHNVRYKLIKYRNKGVRKNLINGNSPDDEYMEKLKKLAISYGVKDIVII